MDFSQTIDHSARIIIRVQVDDVPGSPQDRQNTVARLFCEHMLNRPFKSMTPEGYDFSHMTPDFDTDQSVRRWFIVDLNVAGPLARDEVRKLPHGVYRLCWKANEPVFVPKLDWLQPASKYCLIYDWGGREEQEDLIELKKAP